MEGKKAKEKIIWLTLTPTAALWARVIIQIIPSLIHHILPIFPCAAGLELDELQKLQESREAGKEKYSIKFFGPLALKMGRIIWLRI